jgi:hypothetical protein
MNAHGPIRKPKLFRATTLTRPASAPNCWPTGPHVCEPSVGAKYSVYYAVSGKREPVLPMIKRSFDPSILGVGPDGEMMQNARAWVRPPPPRALAPPA